MPYNHLHTPHPDTNKYSLPLFSPMQDVIIYDTTLRDGEQMPGVSFSPAQKREIAMALEDAGITEIEAGFPAISGDEVRMMREVRESLSRSRMLALSRVVESDIDAAADAGADLVLLFIATSDIHLKYKLHMNRDKVVKKAVEAIEYAKSRGLEPSISSEDSTRTEPEFLKEFLRAGIEAGAVRVGITDTLGVGTPESVSSLVRFLKKDIGTRLSVHLHNDFGLGTANAISGVKAGAGAVAVTMNGMGERAGNVSLEQFVSAMKFLYGADLGVDTTKLTPLAGMVSESSGIPIHPNQPLVGPNAFHHESGIHAAAVLENPETYEPISPDDVGNARRISLGKHSGHHVIRALLESESIDFSTDELNMLVSEVKKEGARNRTVSPEMALKMFRRMKDRDT